MDVPCPEFDDVFVRALLEANGVALDDDAVIEALDSPIEVLREAAARTLGAHGVREAVPRLQAAAPAGDGTDRAGMLSRLGDPSGVPVALRALKAENSILRTVATVAGEARDGNHDE